MHRAYLAAYRQDAPLQSLRPHQHQPSPSMRPHLLTISCDVCRELLPSTSVVGLSCTHFWCQICLTEAFERFITNPHESMLPKCCDAIPIEDIAPMLGNALEIEYKRAYAEFSAAARLYCPRPTCSAWIRLSDMSEDGNHGTCRKCGTKVCPRCRKEEHPRGPCPKDQNEQQLGELFSQRGWRHCWNCNEMIERTHGCSHMTCRCGAQFCYTCGQKWEHGNTCGCRTGDNYGLGELDMRLATAIDPGIPPAAFNHAVPAGAHFDGRAEQNAYNPLVRFHVPPVDQHQLNWYPHHHANQHFYPDEVYQHLPLYTMPLQHLQHGYVDPAQRYHQVPAQVHWRGAGEPGGEGHAEHIHEVQLEESHRHREFVWPYFGAFLGGHSQE